MSEHEPQDAAPRPGHGRLKATVVVVLVLGAVFAAMLLATGKVGTVEVTDAGVTKYIARVSADAQVSVPIALQEGGDVEHESDHIFPMYEGLGGVEKVTVSADGSSVIVYYDSTRLTPEVIREATAQGGYLVQTP